MSVLIGMLDDLDRRGAALPGGPGLRAALHERGAPAAPALARRRVPAQSLPALAGLLAAAGVLGVVLVHPRAALPGDAANLAVATTPGHWHGHPARARSASKRPDPTRTATPATPPVRDASDAARADAAAAAALAVAPAVTAADTSAVTTTGTLVAAPAAAAAAPTQSLIRRSGSAEDEAADLGRAGELNARGRPLEAIGLLQRALRDWPARARSRLSLAALLNENGRSGDALEVLLEGVARDPGTFCMPAARQQARMARWDDALATLERTPQGQRDADFHALAGTLAQSAGKAEQAVAQFEAALAAAPARAAWLAGLAAALEQLDRRGAAIAAYRQALALGENTSAATAYARQRLEALAP